MNQRNATPENGIRFKASATVREFVSSHAPGSVGSAGTEARRRQKAPNTESENRMPATAAALGVFRLARVSVRFPAISVFLPSLLDTCARSFASCAGGRRRGSPDWILTPPTRSGRGNKAGPMGSSHPGVGRFDQPPDLRRFAAAGKGHERKWIAGVVPSIPG